MECAAQYPTTRALSKHVCELDDGSPGTCCKDITESWGSMADKVVQPGGIGASPALAKKQSFDAR